MSTLNPNDGLQNFDNSLENLELGDAVLGRGPASLLTKAVRGLLATAVLGSAAAYGAITVKPELVDYLSFIPGMESATTQCTAGACGSTATCGAANACADSCAAAASCSESCGSECGSACADALKSCPSMNGESTAETSTEASSDGTVSAEL